MPIKPKAAKSRSGAKWTEAQYRDAGYHQIKLRLGADTIEALRGLADRAGESMSAIVDGLVRTANKMKKFADS